MSNLKNLPKVLVMMATYNGEKYIEEQIVSIMLQEDVDIHLLICDDGSCDNTQEICGNYTRIYPNITFKINTNNKGVSKNFMDMVYSADTEKYDYFAFSDQDDVWLPDKLKQAIFLLKDYSDEPCLYYSNYINTNENLENLHYGVSTRFLKKSNNLNVLLINNWANGNTMVFNKKLCKILQLSDRDQFMRYYDVWVHLIALSCGKTVADLDHAYILRRLTGSNVCGYNYQPGKFILKRIIKAFNNLTQPEHLFTETAQELKEDYYDLMNEESREIVDTFVALSDSFKNRAKAFFNNDYSFPWLQENMLVRSRIILNQL